MEDILVQASEVRDLGVIITPDIKFTAHISKVISKVNQRVSYFTKWCHSWSKSNFMGFLIFSKFKDDKW